MLHRYTNIQRKLQTSFKNKEERMSLFVPFHKSKEFIMIGTRNLMKKVIKICIYYVSSTFDYPSLK